MASHTLRVALMLVVLMMCAAAYAEPITGTVVDTDGNPVPGIEVRFVKTAHFPDRKSISSLKGAVKTDEVGAFSFDPPTGNKGIWDFVAFEPKMWLGFARRIYGLPEILRPPSIWEGPLVITVSRPGTFEGKVVDDMGAPIPGARVTHSLFEVHDAATKNSLGFYPIEPLQEAIKFFPATTDTDGLFILTRVPEHLNPRVRAEKPGWAVKREYTATPEPDTKVVMVPGGRIVGRIHGPNGKPVQTARLSASSETGYGSTTTNKDGYFAIDGLASGSYRISAVYALKGGIVPEKRGVVVKAGKDTSIGVWKLPQPVRITGRLLDADTGAPIAGGDVRTSSRSWHGGSSALTDESGRYEAWALPGEVYISYGGAHKMYARDMSARIEPVEVTAKGLRGYNIKVKKSDIAKGSVVDGEGKAIVNAIVSVGDPSAGFTAKTDSEGKFTIIVPQSGGAGGG